MAKFSNSSKEKLDTATEALQMLFEKVIEKYDCIILQGVRSEEEQAENVNNGKSKTLKSKHLPNKDGKAEAIDSSPYPIPDKWGKISYGLIPIEYREEIKQQIKELAKFYHYGGYVQGVADTMNIPIKWGGDWDNDKDFNDQTFDDLVHFEES